eukprot:gene2260-17870_t
MDVEKSFKQQHTKTKETEVQEVEIALSDRDSSSLDSADGVPAIKKGNSEVRYNKDYASLLDTPVKSTPEAKGASVTPQKSIKRTSSIHVKRHDSKGRADSYQLSPDLQAVTNDLLANKYGGKEKANSAAKVIQEYYRHWVLSRSFKRMRAYSEKRKKSITRYPERILDSDRKRGQNTMYNIENPVLIVDLENGQEKDSSLYLQTKEEDENTTLEAERTERTSSFLKTMSRGKIVADEKGAVNGDGRKILLPSDTMFYCGSPKENKVEKETLLGSSRPVKPNNEAASVDDEAEEEKQGSPESEEISKKKITRSDSSDSYEIIDAQQLMQVYARDAQSVGSVSSVSSDTIDDRQDVYDSTASSMFYDDDRYPPTVDKSRKWKYRIGINLFNSKPEDGIEYLVDNELIQNNPKSVADFLRKETSIAKQKISEYFGNFRKEMNRLALSEFASSFDFANKEIDEALRQFQSYFKLTGEAQSIERFLQVFSEQYVVCNPDGMTINVDTVLLLSYAMAMLNTDLHNENVKRKMTVDDFINNLRGTDDGKDFPREMLLNIYNRIQKNEFSTGADHMTQLKQIEQSFIGKIPSIAEPHRQFVKLFTLEEVHDPNRIDKPHMRLAFLFNDLLLLAKPRIRQGGHGGGQITLKASYKLLGMQLAEFSNEHYKYGVYLQTKIDSKTVARFNLKDEKMRKSFVEDLDDCIRETTGMNNIRIALSKSKHAARGNYIGPQSMTLDRKKIKRKTEGGGETLSLLNVQITSLEAEELTSKNRASSMLNISEAASDTESEPSMRRSNSSNSLDNAIINPPREPRPLKKIRSAMRWMKPASSSRRRSESSNTRLKHSSLPRISEAVQNSSSVPRRKHTLFGFSLRRKTSVENSDRRREVGKSTFFEEVDDIKEKSV